LGGLDSDDPVFLAARFPTGQLAALGRERLRRFQAREAGKVRLVIPLDDGAPTVVAGPIRGLDLEDAMVVVADLGGEVLSAVRRP
jgi:hypothetical protein